MRFHVVALPHTQTMADYSACAYTAKVINFCKMMMARGHEVFLYAGEYNEAPCTEHVVCISDARRAISLDGKHYTQGSFDWTLPHWQSFNREATAAIFERAKPRDFLCVIGGAAHKPIADALAEMMCVEFGVGYGGTFAKYRVFESYAWMHTCYGAAGGSNPHNAKGDHWFDTVIPGYFDPADFPDGTKGKKDYFLFVGRLNQDKGINIAVDVCRQLNERLIIAGPGTPPDYGEYVGVVGPAERGRLMAGAKALFAPTTYIEPFGNVVIEAAACGTPAITTDWGAFTETVDDGMTGYRCRIYAQFLASAQIIDDFDRAYIRRAAISRYGLERIAKEYEFYFQRLQSLWGEGWYAGYERPVIAA